MTKLIEHRGFKRLCYSITFFVFMVSFIPLMVGALQEGGKIEYFLLTILISTILALIVFIIIRVIYWIIDGFCNEKS